MIFVSRALLALTICNEGELSFKYQLTAESYTHRILKPKLVVPSEISDIAVFVGGNIIIFTNTHTHTHARAHADRERERERSSGENSIKFINTTIS